MKYGRRLIIMLCGQIVGLLFAAILNTITRLLTEKRITGALTQEE